VAKYDTARFTEAAAAYFKEYGEAPDRKHAAEQAGKTRQNAEKLAKKLGKEHPAFAGLDAVARLRLSIARRFITLSVAPLAPAPAPVAKAATTTKAPAKARPARQPKAEAPAEQAPASV
jgi:hypothetical protein